MKIRSITKAVPIAVSILLLVTSIYGHGDHKHGAERKVDKKEAIQIASKGVANLVSKKEKIDGVELNSSWNNTDNVSKTIHKKGEGYFIVQLANRKLVKSLYILISDDGEIYDANFSGIFKNLKE
ncbi:DUF6488 family protein [Leptospira kmetyi]|uniref:PepSY domain-containing protein n=1 Tax=Leptospira kmetyi TaxID=408139 RepID=A0ABX4N7X7_9LEPT|nr:DUF6488 family protein [Leptospira kmetyi]PJZ29494.1 hypothetical protein CH378_12460 [Leptospira kmetyi]